MSAEPAAFWDTIHRRHPRSPGRPHPYLVDALGPAIPGTALDLGCGTGANAIWLAGQGWEVTGVDISGEALERAAEHAREAGVQARVRWEQADLAAFEPPAAVDLVTAFFVHSPLDLDAPAALARAARRVRAGGTLLVLGHYTLPPWAWDPDATDGLPRAAELAPALGVEEPDWRLRRAEELERTVTAGDGATSTVLDAVVHAERVT